MLGKQAESEGVGVRVGARQRELDGLGDTFRSAAGVAARRWKSAPALISCYNGARLFVRDAGRPLGGCAHPLDESTRTSRRIPIYGVAVCASFRWHPQSADKGPGNAHRYPYLKQPAYVSSSSW